MEVGFWQTERGNLACNVVPVLQEGELESCNGGAFDAEMRVAPWSESFAVAHVFIPNIQAPEKGHEGIDDHEFAVVSEIDLEAAAELAVGDEALNEDAFLAETG